MWGISLVIFSEQEIFLIYSVYLLLHFYLKQDVTKEWMDLTFNRWRSSTFQMTGYLVTFDASW